MEIKMETITLNHDHGALTQAPIYEQHKRGKNWLAIIDINPTKPGGLDRKFVSNANGEYLFMISELKEGQAIEFGADYYSGKGRKSPKRFYGVIRRITENTMEIEKFKTGKEAVNGRQ